jgi:hypothetical protein
MAQVLKNILSFTGLGIGVPASLPHGLNRNTGPATPRLIAANAPGFTITANTINVTVTRTTGGAAVSVYAELWHTYEDAEPYPGLALANFPFVIDANGGGGGGGGSNIILDNQGVVLPGNPFTTLDFTGGGVVAANAGAGLATITIPGTVTTDGLTITGDGSVGNPLVGVAAPASVVVDGVTITGDGSVGLPLAVIPSGLDELVQVATDGITITGDGTTGNPLVATGAGLTGFGSQFLGDGSDGALVYDGVATVLGVVPVTEPATSPYAGARAYFLDRDIFGTSITIAANTVVVGNGQRVWCTGDIAGPGKIARSGSPGVTATTNAGGAGGNGTSTDFLGGSGAGGNGGAGGNPNAIGNGGGFGGTAPYRFTAGGTAITPTSGATGATGATGQGGSGGSTEAAGTGGPGGVNVITNTTNGGYVATHPQYLTGRTLSNAPFTGGTGGGGGAGGYATSGPTANAGGGGGGGGGAGPLVVAARSFSGGVTIEARGGNGGAGADAVAGGVANGGAGGAGGAGSWVAVCYAEGAIPAVTVTGGTGGAGGASAGGAIQAGAGGAGGAGFALVFNLGS